MAQIPIPFSSSFRSLTLNVTTGTPPNQVTYPQAITSVFQGNNSFQITEANILTAFNSQAVGTTFTPSIVATYGSDSNGDAFTSVSTPSTQANFIARVISLANIPNKLTTDTSFSLSSLITTVSAGNISYLSSNQTVATVNSSGQVTPVGAGTTTITVTQAATSNHLAGTASKTFTVSLPPPPISRASNNVTIQYTGLSGNVPSNSPLFLLADPRNTGSNEWFAVVTNSSKTQITSYAKNEQSGQNYFTTSGQLVLFNNIVTTLMTDMSFMFYNTTLFNSDISEWDTAKVTDIRAMFYNARQFKQPLNSWNVSNVTNMESMFNGATVFNQPLNLWNVSAVKNMNYMFLTASAFDQPLNSWDVSKVTSMIFMFNFASVFNQPLNSWNVSAVTDMSSMFSGAKAFNQPLNSWNVSAVTNMSGMFAGTSQFDQPLDSWSVSAVTSMSSMFRNARVFKHPLNSWNVSNVTNMSDMFNGATVFNQPLNLWNVSAVTNMSSMFNSAAAFNQNLSGWNVALTPDRPSLSRSNFAIYSPLALPENAHKLPLFV